jgi:DNA-binding transcriptional ArsR family regulator
MSTAAEFSLDKTFAALAHPTRRAILAQLARDGSDSVTDLAAPHGVSLMAISKHVRIMQEAGLVKHQKDGRVKRCRLDPVPLKQAQDWIRNYRRFWEGQFDQLEEFLGRSESEETSG